MLKKTMFIILLAFLLCPLTALASMYVGASVGNTWQSGDVNVDLDGIGNEIKNIDGHELKLSSSGWDVAATGHLEIAIIDIFAKAGAFFWSADSTYRTISEDESGTDFLWGLGAGVSLGPIGVRLEWESIEVSGLKNLSLLSLGATLGF